MELTGRTHAAHESAPATAMVATLCAACSRPLVDAQSVEAGLGPECRKRHGYLIEVPAEARGEANKLVHRIACTQDGPEVLKAVNRLIKLGFIKLATRIAARVADVTLTADGETIVVEAPYRAETTYAWRRIPGRRWDAESKANRVPSTAKMALWALLKAHYAGCVGYGPKGLFVI